jgi:hypothetical protein
LVGGFVDCDETTRSFETAEKSRTPCLQIRPGNDPGRNPNIAFSKGRIGVLRPEIIAEIGGGHTLVNQKACGRIGLQVAEN